MSTSVIRFDWAIKKLLRNKANFGILEGFLTVVLNEKVYIQEILESESNKADENAKFNRVDLLVKNSKEEYIIIEVQNNKEYDYFQRMLYGVSKVITEHLEKGQKYAKVKKVYTITIAYFDLGQGEDYVYHGKTEFRGLHSKDKLQLLPKQAALFSKNSVHEIYPEYWLIKADKFDDKVSDKLDEWIYFLKHSEIPDEFTAPGLQEAKEALAEIKMSKEERRHYEAYQKRLHDIASEKFTQAVDFADMLQEKKQEGMKEGIKKGKEEGAKETYLKMAKKLKAKGIELATIAELTGLSKSAIQKL